ncbi:hypothetical protein Dda_6063 [Drechslerella dactyloides]|uniref:Uncharacterized protein n=1 Tax=Drechslerella dactyloides TaxID=74499 RepID=A0AAD6NI68_DREDA|nr:hypothetical protein Dda_6063 [Drechslerella dactyloides]
MEPPPDLNIIKTFQAKGLLQQYRLAAPLAFKCDRCLQDKKAKLITAYGGQWDSLWCNGCYGNHLSQKKPTA